MSIVRTIQFGLYALDGSPQTGETHGTDWQAKHSINGAAAQDVDDADTAELGDGIYTASVTADATDKVIAWATYKDTQTQVDLTAPGRAIGPWVETPDVPTTDEIAERIVDGGPIKTNAQGQVETSNPASAGATFEDESAVIA